MKTVTLLFLRREGQILLAMKKRAFGKGKWNGVGGKVEPGETIIKGVTRECQEEISVIPRNLKRAGYIEFSMPADPQFDHACHIFTSDYWEGEPRETGEMRPEWFAIDNLPYDKMWADTPLWLPHILANRFFSGTISATHTDVLEHTIRTYASLKEIL